MSRTTGDSVREFEARLRSEADGFRRAPSPSFQERVRNAIADEATTGNSLSFDGLVPFEEPAPLHPWRDRMRTTSVAAAVIVAAGLWVFALAGVLGGGATGGAGNGLSQGAPGTGSEASTPASALVRFARTAPDSLTSAVENPLLAELGRIAEDATSAARFLVGRLPAPLASRAEDRR